MTPNAFDPQQTASESVPQRHADVSPQTIEALQASEARYRDLFEHAEDVIFSCTLDGTITSVNQAAERLLG
jgi:PAS domain-containing protein